MGRCAGCAAGCTASRTASAPESAPCPCFSSVAASRAYRSAAQRAACREARDFFCYFLLVMNDVQPLFEGFMLRPLVLLFAKAKAERRQPCFKFVPAAASRESNASFAS